MKELTWKPAPALELLAKDTIISSTRRSGQYFVVRRLKPRRVVILEGGYRSGLRHRIGFVSSIKAAKIVCNLLIK